MIHTGDAAGPRRGRGESLPEARDSLLSVVPDEHRDAVTRSSLEAMYEAEDAEEMR